MAAEYDATEFVDSDFQSASKVGYTGSLNAASGMTGRAPTREEVDSKMGETQQKLAELKRIQEELERERSGLEETRRRQMEFQTGREEMLQQLTRGVGLLTESEFAARRDSEQMAKSLAELQVALDKVMATSEQGWTKENFSMELTRALTVIENARMEWHTARLKFPVLSGVMPEGTTAPAKSNTVEGLLTNQSLGQLCKLGLALTWPLALVALIVGLLMIACLRH